MKQLLLFFCMFLSAFSLLAQVGGTELPTSWTRDVDTNFKPIVLPPIDFSRIAQEDSINDFNKSLPWRYGIEQGISVNIKDRGELVVLDNGDKIWRIAFTSQGAVNLSVNFSKFVLPVGSRLQLYNGANSDVSTVYTHLHNRSNQRAGTWFLEGDEIWIEYFEPVTTASDFKLEIESIIHGYRMGQVSQLVYGNRDLNDAGECNYDVNCEVGQDFDGIKNTVKKAVALLNLGNGYLCSSVLLNNVERDKTPYLLTANHCLDNSNTDLWSARFNWISPAPICGTGEETMGVENNFTLSGAEVKANNPLSDFALVEFYNGIPDSWDVAFAGWDNTDTNPGFGVGIHHPNGDIMKICRDNSGAVKENAQGVEVWLIGGGSAGTGNGWELGTTESGSSGSPLFNENGYIIGQLYGGQSFCDGTSNNGEFDIYGRFAVSWDAGNSESQRLKDWLDPQQTGQTQIETLSNILSIPENEFIGDLQIYPNPVSSLITVMNSKYPNLTYGLYDVVGKQMQQGTLHNTSNTISVENLADGVYFLHLVNQDDSNAITKKIVVRK
ncbi:T9SS type A sorting domain-containing protein [Marinirhabdus gelatinilytica]|uniref:Putative secreted protein (Por secretion system target) n=1 Tax=Marinirhabdus gelatinilytica TaxID=1703343 RepID=A0A370Q869_9FLAO|nr:T9SS type A sorting domain-containing protein [Marinirhabdus gelatinilytica]RDK84240.1 putative secreted protein (Por secretion system target) [Marinirhabdus gelatinilytica]